MLPDIYGRESSSSIPRPPGQAMSKRAVALRHLETVLNSGREHLARRPPPEASQRPVVEQAVDALHLLLGDVVEPAAFRQDDPNDAVAVLVRPPLPRVVRLREEDVEAAIPHEHLELRILLAVVKRQGLHHLPRQIPQQRLEHGHDGIRLLGRRIPHQREARHALDYRDEVPRAAQPVDEAALTVTRAGSVLDALRAQVDVDAARDASASRARIALAALVTLSVASRQDGKDLLRLAPRDEPLAGVNLRRAVALALMRPSAFSWAFFGL